MAHFKKPLVIQRQIDQYACISACACSVIDALGVSQVPSQAQLHPLVLSGMQNNNPGFNSLAAALRALKVRVVATRHTPSPSQLVAWLRGQSAIHQAILVSQRGTSGPHITVVYHDQCGNWFQADPGPATVASLQLEDLLGTYVGDVAVIA